MHAELVKIPMEGGEVLSGRINLPESEGSGTGIGIVMAHGAGNDMDTPLLVNVAEGLTGDGFAVMRFNFPYRDAGKSRPDPEPRLQAAWSSAMAEFKRRLGGRVTRYVAAGKSLGARIASQMSANGQLETDALVFYGYPLHAPGKKDRPRDGHLYRIEVPMLFFAGTRDALCDLTVLKSVLEKISVTAPLVTIEGGDHSFNVPKSVPVTSDDIYETLVDDTTKFLINALST